MGTIGDKQPSFDLTQDFGLPPPTSSESTGGIRDVALALNKDGITKTEANFLISQINLAIGDPSLSPGDKAVLQNFLDNLMKARASLKNGIGTSDPAIQNAMNDWMNVSAVVDLFTSVNEITMLISRMSREESKLKQALGVAMLAMAKEAMNLAINAGELRAQQMELEAAKCWVEFGLALGQIAIAASSMAATSIRETQIKAGLKADLPPGQDLKFQEKVSARHTAQQDIAPGKELATSTITAMKSAIEAGIYAKKADLERSASQAEAVSQFVNKLYNLLNDTYSMLGQDMESQRQFIKELMGVVEGAQRTMAEQWKA